jgi:hypothetical protein
MHAKRELLKSLRILQADCLSLLDEFSVSLEEVEQFSEEDFSKRWDKLRRDLREVSRSIYDEHQRDSRKQKKLE